MSVFHQYFSLSSLTLSELRHETHVVKNPYDVSLWYTYLTETRSWKPTRRFALYSRALHYLPGSYKLWHDYLLEFSHYMLNKHPLHPGWKTLDTTYARAVECLAYCVRIWEEWIEFAVERGWWKRGREILKCALRSLAVTQHWRVWEAFLKAGREKDEKQNVWRVPEVGIRVMKRWCVLNPGRVEGLFEAYVGAGRFDEAVKVAGTILGAGGLRVRKKRKEEENKLEEGVKARLWRRMVDVGVEQSAKVTTDVPQMIMEGINETKAETGELWVKLGEFYIRRGHFERARKVYKEAVDTVLTVRDFAVVYDAWIKFEEGLVTSLMDMPDAGNDSEIEAGLVRLEDLTSRRPELLSSVMLRQNPHNVHEWHKRVGIHKKASNPVKVVEWYTKAVKTVDPWRATNGRPHTLWLAFAHYYEDASVPESARQVFDKAVSDPEHFRFADDLAAVWCEYAEMELRLGSPKKARAILLRATKQPTPDMLNQSRRKSKMRNKNNATAALGLGTGKASGGVRGLAGVSYDYSKPSAALESWKSSRLWSFLCDLTLSICDMSECIDLYNIMLDKKVATPSLLLHSAEHLLSMSYFNAAFDLLDRATKTFPFPTVLPLWIFYLERFVMHYKHTKLERARYLFSRSLEQLSKSSSFPEKTLAAKVLHLAHVKFELEYGSPRLAMTALSKATEAVDSRDKLLFYKLYIERASKLWGTSKTRSIYEEALEKLGGKQGLEIAARFAKTEEALGEIARARKIYSYGCQCLLEASFEADWYWNAWRTFELEHGDEDTFRDMLRVKRSIEQRMPSRLMGLGNAQDAHMKANARGEAAIAALERAAKEDFKRDVDAIRPDSIVKGKDGDRNAQVEEGEIQLDLDGTETEEDAERNPEVPAEREPSKADAEEEERTRGTANSATNGSSLKIGPEAKARMKDAVLRAAGMKDTQQNGTKIPGTLTNEKDNQSERKTIGALERFKRKRAKTGTANE